MNTSSIAEAVPSQVMRIFSAVKQLTAMERLMLAKLLLESVLSGASDEKADQAALNLGALQRDRDAMDVPTDSGWPPGFFEATAGAWAGEPVVREAQGDYEVRDELV